MRLTATSLSVTRERLTRAEWDEALGRLARIDQGSRWWIGDLLVEHGKRYGETYAEAARITGRSEQTLQHWKRISSRIEPEFRWAEMRWSHFREVERLDSDHQAYWLLRARDEGWTAAELRREIGREAGGGNERPEAFPDPEAPGDGRRPCPTCGGSGWIAEDHPGLVAVS